MSLCIQCGRPTVIIKDRKNICRSCINKNINNEIDIAIFYMMMGYSLEFAISESVGLNYSREETTQGGYV